MGAYEEKLFFWGETHLQLLIALKMNVKDFLEHDGLRIMHQHQPSATLRKQHIIAEPLYGE